MTYDEAKREIRMEMLVSGVIDKIDGKKLISEDGYFYLDGEKVIDIDALLEKIMDIDDGLIRARM